jgi:thioredoxin-like negative regulator of GroEL
VKRDPPYELLQVFDLLGSGQPLITTDRRKLYQALY